MDTLLVCIALCAAQPSAPPAPDHWLAEDKLKHFAMSYLITAGAAAAARTATDKNASMIIGVSLSGAAGILKELRDERRSFKDLVWDAAGIAAGYVVVRQVR